MSLRVTGRPINRFAFLCNSYRTAGVETDCSVSNSAVNHSSLRASYWFSSNSRCSRAPTVSPRFCESLNRTQFRCDSTTVRKKTRAEHRLNYSSLLDPKPVPSCFVACAVGSTVGFRVLPPNHDDVRLSNSLPRSREELFIYFTAGAETSSVLTGEGESCCLIVSVLVWHTFSVMAILLY